MKPCLFCRDEFKYEVIPGVQKQFKIVKRLLNRTDVETIYVCTDSGREGEYIYRLVAQMAGVKEKETAAESGSILRQRKKSLEESVRRRILSVHMTIWRILHICGQRKII